MMVIIGQKLLISPRFGYSKFDMGVLKTMREKYGTFRSKGFKILRNKIRSMATLILTLGFVALFFNSHVLLRLFSLKNGEFKGTCASQKSITLTKTASLQLLR